MAADLDELANRLEAIAEEIADAALALLRDAVENGATERPPDEKRLTRAERQVRKAASIMREPG